VRLRQEIALEDGVKEEDDNDDQNTGAKSAKGTTEPLEATESAFEEATGSAEGVVQTVMMQPLQKKANDCCPAFRVFSSVL